MTTLMHMPSYVQSTSTIQQTHVGCFTMGDGVLHEVATLDVQVVSTCMGPCLPRGDYLIE